MSEDEFRNFSSVFMISYIAKSWSNNHIKDLITINVTIILHISSVNMTKQLFIDSLLSLPSNNRSTLYKTSDISEKMDFMSSPIPTDNAERIRWQRLHLRYKIIPYQSVRVLYLKGDVSDSTGKRVLAIEELYDVMHRTHLEHNHVRKVGLYKQLCL